MSTDNEESQESTLPTEEDVPPADPGDVFPIIGGVKKHVLKPKKPPPPEWFLNAETFGKGVNEEDEESLGLDTLENVLDSKLLDQLKENGITHFFPVQQTTIPYIVQQLKLSRLVRPRDVCVSSPTGSGKTLAFALPIIQHLSNRVVTAIRALIVFPVVDLALQVASVFQSLVKRTTLKVGCAVGRQPFEEDMRRLLRENACGTYESTVDILITTPGRLKDLINRAPGFSLKKLEILVLDEADRLMNNELENNFLGEVSKAVSSVTSQKTMFCLCGSKSSESIEPIKIDNRCACSLFNPIDYFPPMKLLFSATLSSDPEKLQVLNLFKPKFFLASDDEQKNQRFVTPSKLEEKLLIIDQEMKPLALRYLIEKHNYRKVLCFTKSVEATDRLHYLLQDVPGVKVAKIAANAALDIRDKLVQDFSNGTIHVVICSDLLARGMDINADYVVNYDPPSSDTAYVHRVGRTARAGKSGTAVTLVSPSQIDQFSLIMRHVHKGNANQVTRIKIKKSELKPMIKPYKASLSKLEKNVGRKRREKQYKRNAMANRVK